MPSNQIGRQIEEKLSLFVDNPIWEEEKNPKESTKTSLELINKSSKFPRCKAICKIEFLFQIQAMIPKRN